MTTPELIAEYEDSLNEMRVAIQEISEEIKQKVKRMRDFAKANQVTVMVECSAEYYHTKEEAESEPESTHDFREQFAELMLLQTGGVYFQAASKYDWGSQIESEDITSYFE